MKEELPPVPVESDSTVRGNAKKKLPENLRPFLWYIKWEDVDVYEDKDDIITNIINEGTLDHWHWIIKTYGRNTIREVLKRHLASEFHPESRNLARVIFSLPKFSNARRSSH